MRTSLGFPFLSWLPEAPASPQLGTIAGLPFFPPSALTCMEVQETTSQRHQGRVYYKNCTKKLIRQPCFGLVPN